MPDDDEQLSGNQKQLAHDSQALLKELANISLEIAQMVVSQGEDGVAIPDWFILKIIRDLPRLAKTVKK